MYAHWERVGRDARSGVVVAEHLQLVRLTADGDCGEEGEEVSGAADGSLTDEARRVRTGGALDIEH